MQKANVQSAKLSVISQISGAYFMLLGQKEQLKDLLQLVHDEKKLRKLEWMRYKNGAEDLSKVTRVDQSIAAHRASVPALESSIFQIENAIQVLLNRNPGPLVRHGELSRLAVHQLIPVNLPSAVLKNRPDIMVATYQLQMAEYNLGIAYSHFFPTINLTGMLGGASVALAHVLSLSTGLWIAQAAASAPLLNGVTYAQIQAAKAGYYAVFYTYLQTVRSAFADVDNVLTNQLKVNQAYAARVKGLHDAKRLYDFAVARYKLGAKDAREVAQEKLNLDEAKLNLTLAKMQQLDSIVQVYQALAGGYG
jgi:multidrug efflux system outer membrane protein